MVTATVVVFLLLFAGVLGILLAANLRQTEQELEEALAECTRLNDLLTSALDQRDQAWRALYPGLMGPRT